MDPTIAIIRAEVYLFENLDRVILYTELPDPTPGAVDIYLTVDLAPRTGVEWVTSTLGLHPELIMRAGQNLRK